VDIQKPVILSEAKNLLSFPGRVRVATSKCREIARDPSLSLRMTAFDEAQAERLPYKFGAAHSQR
jgi:hypothetical protein